VEEFEILQRKTLKKKTLERKTMEPESKGEPTQGKPGNDPTPAVQHVAGAHQLLKGLREKFGLEQHPELQEAITKLELALNDLTVNTGGMF
jgi:hypothetical protein